MRNERRSQMVSNKQTAYWDRNTKQGLLQTLIKFTNFFFICYSRVGRRGNKIKSKFEALVGLSKQEEKIIPLTVLPQKLQF